MRLKPKHFFKFLILLSASTAAHAQTASVEHDCNLLAAHPEHPNYPATEEVPGVWYEDMDTEAAIAACEVAVAAFPDNPRYHLQLGRALDIAGRDAEANAAYQTAIDLGDPVAMVNLGWNHHKGEGAPQSDERYFELAQSAADTGYPRGYLALGEAYWFSYGVEQDDTKAVELFRQAADLGNFIAMEYMGNAYRFGRGVEQDAEQAIEWHLLATSQGNPTSFVHLGDMYYDGEIVEEDPVKATAYYQSAAAEGDADGMANLAWSYEEGYGISQDIDKAIEWYRKASDKGIIWATDNLAYLLSNSDDADEQADALGLWEAVVDSGHETRAPRALDNIGWLYVDGIGVEADPVKAIDYFEQAAELGNIPSNNSLGWMYRNAEGLEQDLTLSRTWYQKGVDLGDNAARYGLALLHYQALGTERDDDKVIALVTAVIEDEEASDRSLYDAYNLRGIMFELGRGVPESIDQALADYQQAAELGNDYSRMNIAAIYKDETSGMFDPDAALAIYQSLYETGDPADYGGYGHMYQDGIGVDVDLDRAIALYDEGVENGDTEAMRRLAALHAMSAIPDPDGAFALSLFQQSIDLQDYHAYYAMAQAYEAGFAGAAPDADKAAEAIELSLALGRPETLEPEAPWQPETLSALQTRLAARGLYGGPINGEMTEETLNAMRMLFVEG